METSSAATGTRIYPRYSGLGDTRGTGSVLRQTIPGRVGVLIYTEKINFRFRFHILRGKSSAIAVYRGKMQIIDNPQRKGRPFGHISGFLATRAWSYVKFAQK